MTERPQDIPQWAWDAAEEPSQACFDASVDLYETGMETANVQLIVARAILQARSQAYEECAKIAETVFDTAKMPKNGRGKLYASGETALYASGRISQAIRSKANTKEGQRE